MMLNAGNVGWARCLCPPHTSNRRSVGTKQRAHPTALSVVMTCCLVVLLLTGCGGGSGDDDSPVSLASGNLILDATHGGEGAAWGLPDCSACHALSSIHEEADLIRGLVREKGYLSCAGCHGSNGTDSVRRCTLCHNQADLPTAPYLQGAHAHNFNDGVGLVDSQCLDCHDASDMDGRFEVNRDLTRYPDASQIAAPYASISDFCLRCHNRDHQQPGFEIAGSAVDDPLIAIEDDYRYIDNHGFIDGTGTGTYAGLRDRYVYASRVECSDCHAMHGTGNDGLIIDSSLKGVSQLDPLLRNQPYSVSVSGGDTSQLCVLCHQMSLVLDDGAVDTGNGLSGVHQVGGDCLACHSHGEAVQAGL